MRLLKQIIGVFLVVLGPWGTALAIDISGDWTTEFDTQIGVQKYTFNFVQEGDTVTGNADAEIEGDPRKVEFREGRIEDHVLTFHEIFTFQGNEIRIEYKGTVGNDEIHFTRNVGDFATEQLVATRLQSRSAVKRSPAAGDHEMVRLYVGPAPGSEDWSHEEKEIARTAWGGPVIANVVDPTLTIIRPDPEKANGTAVVICPGGGFFLLSINAEGMDVARALAAKGVTCFVLRYRLVQTKTGDPAAELMSSGDIDPLVKPIVPLALADGQAAIKHVRKNAMKYGVNPKRIGIMGFSAGGTVASSVAFNYKADSRPDFAAPIYLAYSWTIKDAGVPADAPPMFILAATDDQLGLAADSVDLYQDWTSARKPAELHLYAEGGHGFGMNTQGKPTDGWIQRFSDWLDHQGLLEKE